MNMNMSLIVNTTYKTNASGRGQILAKANGKQRTVSYDDARTADYNHAAGAAALANVLGVPKRRWRVVQTVLDNGKQTFAFSW